MQIHQLSPKHKSRTKKRIGRGGKKGTYSGKGIKGQKSRAGRKMVPFVRELIKKYPKLKGYRRSSVKNYFAVVNLSDLEKRCENGDVVTPEFLAQKKLIRKVKNRIPKVKILGTGKFTKKINLQNCLFSKSVKKIVEAAGGTIQ